MEQASTTSDAAPSHPEPAAEAARPARRRLWIFAAAAVLALIAGRLVYASYRAWQTERAVRAAADQFFTQATRGKIHEAYLSTSQPFQQATSEAKIPLFLASNHLASYGGADWTSTTIIAFTATLDGALNGDGARVPIEIRLVNEDGTWKVDNLDASVGRSASGTLSVVQTGPPPSLAEAQGMASAVIESFKRAMRTRDFSDFYASFSARFRASVTQEKIKSSFLDAFKDPKYNLWGYKTGAITFSEAPGKTAEGYLQMRGEAPMKNSFLQFIFTYEFDRDGWRLGGIRLTVK